VNLMRPNKWCASGMPMLSNESVNARRRYVGSTRSMHADNLRRKSFCTPENISVGL